jgi:hypothetical protein
MVALAAALVALGCDDSTGSINTTPRAVAVVGSGLVYSGEGFRDLWVMDTSGASARVTQTRLAGPIAFRASVDGLFAALVVEEEPALHVITSGAGPVVSHGLPAPYDTFTLAPSADWAVCWTRGNILVEGQVFQNANEIALVRVDEAPDPERVVRRTLRSFGGSPEAAYFPDRRIQSSTPYALVVDSGSQLAVVDLDNPTARDVAVPLALGTNPSLAIDRTLFLADPENPGLLRVFLWSNGGTTLLGLNITAKDGPSGPDAASLAVTAELFVTPGAVFEVLPVQTPGGLRLLLTGQPNNQVALLDPESAETVSIGVDGPATTATPLTPAPATRVLLSGPSWSGFAVLDFGSSESAGTLENFALGTTLDLITAIPGQDRVLATSGDRSRVVAVDTRTGSVTSFTAVGAVVGTVYPGQGNAVFIATQSADAGYLVRLDLDTEFAEPFELPAAPVGILALSPGGVAVDTAARGGLTVLWRDPAAGPEAAELVAGYGLLGIFDGGRRP